MGFLSDVAKSLGSAFTGNPLGAVSGVIGIGRSLFGSSNAKAQQKYNQQMLYAQKAEANAQRQFQREMSDLNYSRQLEMWNKNNAYNDPSALRQRLVNAGFNPNFAMGGSPSASTMASVVPGSSAGSSVGGPGSAPQPLSDALTQAQLSNIEAMTKKTLADAKKTEAEIPWVDRLSESQVKVGTSVEALNFGKLKLTEKEADMIGKRMEEIDTVIALNKQRLQTEVHNTTLASLNVNLARIDVAFKHAIKDAELQNLLADVGLKEARAKEITQMLPYLIANTAADTTLKGYQAMESNENRFLLHNKSFLTRLQAVEQELNNMGISIKNGILAVDAEVAEDFKYVDKVVDVLGRLLEVSMDAINIGKLIRPKKPKIVTEFTSYDGDTRTSRRVER